MGSKRRAEKELFRRLFDGLVSWLAAKDVNPLALTLAGLFVALLSAALYAFSYGSAVTVALAGLLILISGFFDALDGEVARAEGRVSRRGAFLDSVLDKAGEGAIAVGLSLSGVVPPFLVTAFLATSLLVSYTRSRAESLGVQLEGIGIAERAERLFIVAIASLLYPLYDKALTLALALITILAIFTAIERIRRTSSLLA